VDQQKLKKKNIKIYLEYAAPVFIFIEQKLQIITSFSWVYLQLVHDSAASDPNPSIHTHEFLK
jgi:hypothetical protein